MTETASRDYTPEERQWLAEDWRDPRADCPQRDQHAHRMYGDRWTEARWSLSSLHDYPKIDGKSIAKTHKQIRCEGCNRFMIWLPKSPSSPANPPV